MSSASALNPSAITLTASSLQPQQNTSIVLTATISGATSGFVSFYNGANLIGTSPVNASGVAILNHIFAPGPSTVNAQYSGNATTASSVTTVPVSIATVGTTTQQLSVVGVPGAYQLTDTVTGNALINPTGIVTFTDQTTAGVVGTQALSPGNTVSQTVLGLTGPGLPVGINRAIVLADFNGDQKPDMVVANGSAGSIEMFLGGGTTGVFTAGATYAKASIVNMVAGDFNGDGKMDLLVATSTGVTLYLGDGNGNLTSSTTVAVPCTSDLLAADLNMDSSLDFVCADNVTGKVSPYINDGTGNFTAQAQISVPNVTGMAIAPYTTTRVSPLGGAPNIALSTSLGGLFIYTGNGDGTFTLAGSAASGSYTGQIIFLDIDGDGNMDLAGIGGTGSSHTILYYLGDGSGHFSAFGTYLSLGGVSEIATGDFNGDGFPDIVAFNTGTVYPYLNASTVGNVVYNALLIQGTHLAVDNPSVVVVGDYNNNGLDDMIWASGGGSNRTSILVPVNQSISTSALQTPGPVGPGNLHTVVATYPGNIFYNAATPNPSNAVQMVSLRIPATVTVTPNAPTEVLGNPFTFTAHVVGENGIIPTGTVTFTDSTTAQVLAGPVTLDVTGTAVISSTIAPAGNHTITVTYAPGADPYYLAAMGSTGVSVQKVPSSILLTSSQTTAPANTAVTFTATVSPEAGTYPATGGTVTFYSNGVAIGTGTLNATGVATFTPSPTLAIGQYAISATYAGDSNFTSGSSNTVIETIQGNAVTRTPTTTTVNTTATTTASGVFLTATVTSAVNAPGLTGTVNFVYNGNVIGAGVLGPVTVNPDGSLTATAISSLIASTVLVPQNSYSIAANYLGDVSNLPSNAAATTVAVPAAPAPVDTRTPTTTIVSTTATTTSDGNVYLSAIVTSAPNAPNLTGTVDFVYNGNVIAAGVLGPITAQPGGILSATVVSSAISASVLAPGNTYSISANYLGDTTNLPSNATAVSVVIPAVQTTRTPTTTVVSTIATTTPSGVFLSAVVTSAPNAPNLTGTVNFVYNGNVVGAGVLGPVTVGTNGVLTATATSLPISTSVLVPQSTYSISASYLGDVTNLPSAATAVSVTIPAAQVNPGTGDFSVDVTSSASQTIHPGATASFTVAVGFVNAAFNNPVILSLTTGPGQTGLPAGATVVFTPPSVTPGGGTALATLTIQTPLTTAANNPGTTFGTGYASLALLLLPLLGVRRFRKKLSSSSRTVLLAVLALLSLGALIGVTGCGSGEGYFGAKPKTYTFTVTGTSGSVTHIAPETVTLNLQ